MGISWGEILTSYCRGGEILTSYCRGTEAAAANSLAYLAFPTWPWKQGSGHDHEPCTSLSLLPHHEENIQERDCNRPSDMSTTVGSRTRPRRLPSAAMATAFEPWLPMRLAMRTTGKGGGGELSKDSVPSLDLGLDAERCNALRMTYSMCWTKGPRA